MFASRANKYENGDTNGLDVLNNAGHHLQNPELVDLMDDGIDIVRIKTTEEVSANLYFVQQMNFLSVQLWSHFPIFQSAETQLSGCELNGQNEKVHY